MPNCRNCGARITKFDKDICPVCGTKNPLQGVGSDTMEVTSQIDLNNFQEGQKVKCRRKKLLLFFLAFGFTGAPFFYLKKKKAGIFWLVMNLVILAGVFALLFFLAKLHIAIAILVPVLTVYAISGITGAVYNFLPDLRDGEGEFVV